MKKIGILIILTLFLACLGDDKPKKPDNLIPKDKMANVLHDLFLINGAKGANRKLLETIGFKPETYVLNKYGIDSIQFADSNSYYAFDTEVYKSIIDNVKAKLEKEKEAYEAEERKEGMATKRRRDSIKKVNERKKDSLSNLLGKPIDSIPSKIKGVITN